MSEDGQNRLTRALESVEIAAPSPRPAGAGEVLISEAVHEQGRGRGTVQLKRRWRFSAKGAPKGLKVYAAEPS